MCVSRTMFRWIGFWGVLWCCTGTVQAQFSLSTAATRIVPARQPRHLLDTMTIVPPLTVRADSLGVLPAYLYRLDNQTLILDTARLRLYCPRCRTLTVSYRTLPFRLGTPVRGLDTALIRRGGRDDDIAFDYTPYQPVTSLWGNNRLQTNGAYTRGLSLGNNQNLVFNSNLNLQVEGRLGDDLELAAAISDNSIPLQPDGTTRQLQEFDRVFIRLKRKTAALTAGDFDLLRPNDYFSNYFKRLQGGQVVWSLKPVESKAVNLKLSAAAAISRGKFARQLIEGVEGNQGPYRLVGAEGEQFIIVLAGAEKVFVDGLPMQRGLDNDYTIDYNLGELTFTQRRLISKDSRIIIEFEYAVQAYLRSTTAVQAEWTKQRSRWYIHAYNEQDGLNPAGGQTLSDDARRQLAAAGDNLQSAFASGIDTLTETADPGRVRYFRIDTVACGLRTTVLVYMPQAENARLSARFSEVGQGRGNYVAVQTAANGRVFRWVAPDTVTCRPKGNFEPIIRVIAPESRQLHTAGGQFKLGKSTEVQTELALSNRDLNRFSTLDDGNNAGRAALVRVHHQLTQRDTARRKGQVYGIFEHTSNNFLPLNPYRPAEFARDWNISTLPPQAGAEQWVRSGMSWQEGKSLRARYEFGAFNRQQIYRGGRHFANVQWRWKGFEILGEINALSSSSVLEATNFSRPKMEVSKMFFQKNEGKRPTPLLKMGIYAERERNQRRNTRSDSLSRLSFWYDLARFYIQLPERKGRQLNMYVFQRNDYAPVGSAFKANTVANEINLNGTWNRGTPKATQNLTGNVHWRKLRIIDPRLTPLTAQNTALGRIDYTLSTWKGALNWASGYEIGSGQSPRLEFTYIQVNPGEGQYTWIDRNNDNVLQLDEMEVAVFADQASFVRVAVTTTSYIRTNNILFNQNLRFEARRLMPKAKKGLKLALSRLSTQHTVQSNRRFLSSGGFAWNPLSRSVADTGLLSANALLRNVLFFNRAHPIWDVSVTQNDSRSRIALVTGFEYRQNSSWAVNGRVNWSTAWSFVVDAQQGGRRTTNQAFEVRNVDVQYQNIGPTLAWQPNRTFRVSAEANWQRSQNQSELMETALQTRWRSEISWTPKPSGTAGQRAATVLRSRASLVDIRYTGKPNTAVSFDMLEGLQNGRNILWSLQFDRQLSKTMQLNLTYEGRRTGSNNRTIHTGRMQVRAVF
jgi:hypothetical protein